MSPGDFVLIGELATNAFTDCSQPNVTCTGELVCNGVFDVLAVSVRLSSKCIVRQLE